MFHGTFFFLLFYHLLSNHLSFHIYTRQTRRPHRISTSHVSRQHSLDSVRPPLIWITTLQLTFPFPILPLPHPHPLVFMVNKDTTMGKQLRKIPHAEYPRVSCFIFIIYLNASGWVTRRGLHFLCSFLQMSLMEPLKYLQDWIFYPLFVFSL